MTNDPAPRAAQPASVTALTPPVPGPPGSPAVVAFHLPQYHRIPENDAWWGEGFTDWVNVAGARPLYPGHSVPNVPAALGTYDLLSPQVRSAQGALARAYGVYGFCYYFYWFRVHPLLERPLDVDADGWQPDIPLLRLLGKSAMDAPVDRHEDDVPDGPSAIVAPDVAILDDLMPLFGARYVRFDVTAAAHVPPGNPGTAYASRPRPKHINVACRPVSLRRSVHRQS